MAQNSKPVQLSLLNSILDSGVRYQIHDSDTYFSMIDICVYYSDTKAARQFWNDTKKRLEKEGFQLSENILQLKLEATDGKFYATDTANIETVFRILQSFPVPKDDDRKHELETLKQWMASLAGREVRSIESAKRQHELDKLERNGYQEHPQAVWLKTRHDNINSFQSLKNSIALVCSNPNWGHIINEEYEAFFGMVAGDLKAILNTKSIRDSLPTFQLQLLTAAETKLTEEMNKRDNNLSNAELAFIIKSVVTPLGKALQDISGAFGTHHVTGQPLLNSKN